jgi:hypothetical protein
MKISITLKAIVSISILAFIGAIFCIKYSARISHSTYLPYLIAAIYFIGYLALFIFLCFFDTRRYSWAGNQRFFTVVWLILALGSLVMVIFLPDTSRVSRLLAMKEWIVRLLAGQFPWGVSTQYNPSGLPILYLMALPFYIAGNISLLEVVGVILFCFAIVGIFPRPQSRWLPLAALVLLPSFFYELLVRSELFFNMALIVIFIILSERYLDKDKLNFQFFGLAMLFGLILSTRTIVGLIYAGYYAYKFRQHIWHGILFSGFTLMTFGLTLIPFIIWNAQVFFTEGPFSIQATYLPLGLAVIFAIIAAIVGWKATNLRDLLFSEGVILFVIVAIAFLIAVAHKGVSVAVLKDGFDITYFIFCTPFLLLSLEKSAL